LVKRAAELRDILGLAKCSTLLSQLLAQQSKNSSTDHSVDKPSSRQPMEKTSSGLRPEANVWTPPRSADSPRTVLKKALNIHKPAESMPAEPPPGLLPPFVEYTPPVRLPIAPGTYYLPPQTSSPSDAPTDLTWDGKQFISSLAAKRDGNPPSIPQKPIGPPNKAPSTPPGLAPPQAQKLHSFPLMVSLLPQTFSVHLLSTLHMRFQHVSASLEMLDAAFANELKKTASTHNLNSTRWESWMTPDGAAGMSRALVELRKALDELCGATARAGWIVDTWGAYQGGKLYGSSRPPKPGLGSAAINGVEIGDDIGMRLGLQAPIGRPHSEKGKASSGGGDTLETGGSTRPASGPPTAAEKNGPSFSGMGSFKPPPGLAFPLKPTEDVGPRVTNGSKRFPVAPCAVEGNTSTVNGVAKDSSSKKTEKNLVSLQRHPSIGIAPSSGMAKA